MIKYTFLNDKDKYNLYKIDYIKSYVRPWYYQKKNTRYLEPNYIEFGLTFIQYVNSNFNKKKTTHDT